MGYFKSNLDGLKKFRPSLYMEIEKKLNCKKYDFKKFRYVETRDGIGTIEVTVDSEKIRLNSLYSPQKEAESWGKQFESCDINVSVIMFGIVNGIFINNLLNKLEKNAIVILFEPDINLFLYCLANFNLTSIIMDRRIQIYINKINYDEFYFALRRYINAIMIPTQIVCSYPKLEKIYPEEADEFKKIIKERYILEMRLTYALSDLYRVGIINTIRNIHFIMNSNYSSELIGKVPKHIPFIIVSSGPSLGKNVDVLKKIEGMAFILAVDTAVDFLDEHNISYDAIITIDPMISKENLSTNKCSQCPVFVGIKSSNEIMESNQSHKIWMISSLFMCKLYDELGLKYSAWSMGGSVSTDAFNLAIEMGVERIVLVGQDLAFSKKFTHVGNNVDIENYQDDDIKYVEGINGELIRSRSDWVNYLEWFNARITGLKGKVDVIDATEGGAKIRGARLMKLSEVAEKYCVSKFDFKEVMKNIPPTFSEEEYNIVRKKILDMKIELKNIKNKTKYALYLSKKILERLKNGEGIEEIEAYSNSVIKETNSFIENCLIYTIICDYMETKVNGIMEVNHFSSNENENKIKSYELVIETFKAVVEVVEFVYPILESNLEKI